MQYQIKRSKRRTITLEVKSNAEIVIRAPFRVSDSVIDGLVQKRKDWIAEKLNLVKKRNSNKITKKYIEGEHFLFFGKDYELKFIKNQKEKIVFDNDIYIKEKYFSKSKDILLNWYKQEALKYYISRAGELSLKYDFNPKSIKLSNAKKRLGVCNQYNDIRINWRLIVAPKDVIDYVLVHELVHIKIKNHSKNYWSKIALILPDYKEKEAWLKANKHELFFDI